MEPTITTQNTQRAGAVQVHATTPREAIQQVRAALPLLANRNLTASRTGNSTFEVWA